MKHSYIDLDTGLHKEIAEELGACAIQLYFQLSITLALRWKREIQNGKYLKKFCQTLTF